MKTASFYQDLEFNENKPAIKAILETDFTKEIRILMRKGQEMREHQTPYPIVVELLEGQIIFGAEGQEYEVKKGGILTLSGGIPHHLFAKEESIIRLTISKLDSTKRVEQVAENSK
ncbi:MAG: cupin [Bergeyella zoohelcum]|nr:cupin [Bergeyella zoohelcum]